MTALDSKHIRLLSTPADYHRWDAFVLDHPDGNFSHLSSWKEVLAKSFHHLEPLYLALENNQGMIEGGLPCFLVKSILSGKRIVSLPFTESCDPLVASTEDLTTIVKQLLILKKRCLENWSLEKTNIN